MQACIVTCADKAFFGHLVRWTKRLTAIRLIDVSITILDCGLEPSQIAILQDLGAAVIPAEWDLKVPDRVPAFFKAMAIRPFLPQYCPDAEYLIWVDADCLVLRAEVIFDYVAAAASSDVACCVEVDRCYSSYYRRDYGQPAVYQSVNIISDVASYNAGFYEWHYDVDFAKFLRLSKQINAGVFCAKRASPLWLAWQKEMQSRIDRLGDKFFADLDRCYYDRFLDQVTLNAIVHSGKIRPNFMPVTHNWVCHLGIPYRRWESGALCITQWPFAPIGILHLTSHSKCKTYSIYAVREGQVDMLDVTKSNLIDYCDSLGLPDASC